MDEGGEGGGRREEGGGRREEGGGRREETYSVISRHVHYHATVHDSAGTKSCNLIGHTEIFTASPRLGLKQHYCYRW